MSLTKQSKKRFRKHLKPDTCRSHPKHRQKTASPKRRGWTYIFDDLWCKLTSTYPHSWTSFPGRTNSLFSWKREKITANILSESFLLVCEIFGRWTLFVALFCFRRLRSENLRSECHIESYNVDIQCPEQDESLHKQINLFLDEEHYLYHFV